ncbi:alpha-hydroxy acid oxidase [Pseudemcibacter aquimaris]|uniref:alpha-hydroxy acid oxidase n=1 Tax=Pseudemcibacter aquimaris TaxID=2857064 RepID=UPI0020111AC6|nr:alpha-hydroxy acid oxidase [Pseudemcibacter aquimaris]MCC3860313.1 alpha-hydroxy-acid oxidizing protein [Pseudemcibacter aquimaris]WDU57639.1 alpha-hydroxy-acid oxidizing protein [Pseudemcibacter aquimaris]
MNIKNCINIEDLRMAAKKRAHKMVFDYIDGGSDDEVTLKRNSSAYDDYELMYRVLSGVDNPDMSTTLLGQKIDVPFILSPSAGNRLFHTDGERGPCIAAEKFGTVYSLATLSSLSIEEIGALTNGPKWFQLYVWKDRGLVKEMLDRAKAAGFTAMFLTVDLPIAGNRERDPKNGFTIPPKIGPKQMWEAMKAPWWSLDYLTKPQIRYANLSEETSAISLNDFVAEQLDASFSWDDAEWLLGEWNGPSILKGVVRSDDAIRAERTGFNAISISNHGGRQLDTSPAPISCLDPIRDAVSDKTELIVDGGIRRGTDVLKALAMGANAVSFARPYLYGLAAGGIDGAVRSVEIIHDAIKRDMILLGVQNISDIDESFINRLKP